MTKAQFLVPVLMLAALTGVMAQSSKKYTGPRPPKPDVPFLLHASNLIPTEESEATEEKRKDNTANLILGATSPVRTPLAEPIFLIETRQLDATKIELFQMTVKNGKREVVFGSKANKDDEKKRKRVLATRLEPGLFRIEASQILENGEYCLSPTDSQKVFCFQIY
jgi:hypothetical protein